MNDGETGRAGAPLILRTLRPGDREGVLALIRECRGAGELSLEYLGIDWDEPDAFERLSSAVRDHAAGRGLPPGWVPATLFWLFEDEHPLGWLTVRRELTDALADFGGHIGYGLRPSARGRGYGTRMLALGLDEARNLGMDRVLITCDPANIASARVIEKNSGRFASESHDANGRLTRRYWVDLRV